MSLASIDTPWLYDTGSALAFLGTLTALIVGHLLGDLVLQNDADATGKAIPDNARLATGTHPWTGWPACLRHCRSYLACQVIALLLMLSVVPIPLPAMIAALAVSISTHAVIDRRWLVQRILAAKGCTSWREAPFWIDQALHGAAMFGAALIAVRTTTMTTTVVVALTAVLLIAYALHVEHRHARGVAAGPAPTDRY